MRWWPLGAGCLLACDASLSAQVGERPTADVETDAVDDQVDPSTSSGSSAGSDVPGEPATDPVEPLEGTDIPLQDWTPGLAAGRLPGGQLLDLPGGPAGPPLWVSNNPEAFEGDGWLMQSARTDPTRGGVASPLDVFRAYLFHLNGSGSTRTLHLVVSNPQLEPVTVTARGSLYRNVEHPISPTSGPSVTVAEDRLTGQANVDQTTTLQPYTGAEVASIELLANNMVDGHLDVTATGGVYLYSVVTTSGSATDAINGSQGAPAPGILASPGPNAFGRSAGIYASSEWQGALSLDLPDEPAHIAFAMNTSSKFALDGATLQEQAPEALEALWDSSERHYGAYGVRYDLALELCAGDQDRTVRVTLAHNVEGPTDVPSFVWNGPVRWSGQLQHVSLTPTNPRAVLGEVQVGRASCEVATLELYQPGLITIGQYVQIEAL